MNEDLRKAALDVLDKVQARKNVSENEYAVVEKAILERIKEMKEKKEQARI